MSFRHCRAWFLVLPLLSGPAFLQAQDDPRPVCNSKTQGRLWPEAANTDRRLISHLVRCGELQICVRGTWHYRWESASVRLDQLGRPGKSKPQTPAGCEIQAITGDNARPEPADSSAKLE